MSRTLKAISIGIFICLAIIIFILLVGWLSGKFGSGKGKTFKVYFDNVSGLKIGDPVEVLGVIKGRIKGMKLEDNKVLVIIALSADVKLTSNAKFAIRSLSYIGSDKYLFIEPGTGEPVSPKTLFYGENESLNLELTFLKIDKLIDSLRPMQLGAELSKAKEEMLEAVRGLPQTVKPFATSITELTVVLEKLAVKFDSFSNLLTKQSTVRELLTSKELYDELLKTNSQLQDLIKDLKANPQKYIQLRLFK